VSRSVAVPAVIGLAAITTGTVIALDISNKAGPAVVCGGGEVGGYEAGLTV